MSALITTQALIALDIEALGQALDTAWQAIEPGLNQVIQVVNDILAVAAENPVVAIAVIAVVAWAILTAVC